jgi:predicted MPP superfamily phosphohydrolase
MKGFIFFIFIMQALLMLVHYAFYRYGVSNIALLAKYKSIFGVVLFILSISFTLSMMLVRSYDNIFTANLYYVACVWLGTIFWLFIAVVLGALSQNIFSNVPFIKNILPKIFIILAFVTSAYGLYNAHKTDVVKSDLYVDNLPSAWDGRRALFIADTHYGNIHTKAQASTDAREINAINPDILFVSGDFFDGPKKDLFQFTEFYKNVNPKLGKYLASGNHETYAGLPQSIEALENGGFVIADDKNINIEGVQIIGVPYVTSTKNPLDEEKTKQLLNEKVFDKSMPSILIKHVPISTQIMADAGVSFAFFGHTHKGQMWPIVYLEKMLFGKHYYGFTDIGSTKFYTTSGVGSWGPPQRIGTDSEMLLVTFHKK